MSDREIPNRRRITSEEIEEALATHHDNGDLFLVLEELGRMMLSEVQNQTAAIESKGLAALGWTAALVALSLGGDFVSTAHQSPLLMVPAVVGVVAALCALAAGALCVKVEDWNFPSQRDWFRVDLFGDLSRLRAYQLLSLRENYDSQCRMNDRKAKALKCAQWGLIVATACCGVVLLGSLATNNVGLPIGQGPTGASS